MFNFVGLCKHFLSEFILVSELMNVESNVDEYFELKELEQMSPIELQRYMNLRANYEVMKRMGES